MGNDDFEKWAKILHAKNLAQGIMEYIEQMYMDDLPTDE
jgi:dihydroxyacetone kinase DhaKLM complex PTS-EIIA-like component DhaM